MIIRVAHSDHYTVIRNHTLRDSRLSLKATGLIAYLLSLPDDTALDRRHLEGAKSDGAYAIRMALKELVDTGYLRHDKRQDERGLWRTEWTLYEVPKVPRTGGGKSATGSRLSGGGKPATKSRSNKEKGPRYEESARAPSPLEDILNQCARRLPDD